MFPSMSSLSVLIMSAMLSMDWDVSKNVGLLETVGGSMVDVTVGGTVSGVAKVAVGKAVDERYITSMSNKCSYE